MSRTQQMLDDIHVLLTEPRGSPAALAIKGRLREEAIEKDFHSNPHVYLAGMLDVSAMPNAAEPHLSVLRCMSRAKLVLDWLEVAPVAVVEPAPVLCIEETADPNESFEVSGPPSPDHKWTAHGWARPMRCHIDVDTRTFLEAPEQTARCVGQMLAHRATAKTDWIRLRKREDVYDDRFDEGGYPRGGS